MFLSNKPRICEYALRLKTQVESAITLMNQEEKNSSVKTNMETKKSSKVDKNDEISSLVAKTKLHCDSINPLNKKSTDFEAQFKEIDEILKRY